MANSKLLKDKVAIVTGAASGIGEAIACRFADEGGLVLAVDINVPLLDRRDGQVVPIAIDVTDMYAPECIRTAVKQSFGRLDILVNNAGICLPGNIEDQTLESWERTMAVNVTAPFRITQALVPMLKESRAGRIINLGSIMSDFGGADLCAYGMSKHAIAGFTKSLACDLGKYGITANYLQPGSIWSAMSKPHMENLEFLEYWEKKTPLGRIGDPEDVAAAAAFLATDDAKFMTGGGVRVCGGAMASF